MDRIERVVREVASSFYITGEIATKISTSLKNKCCRQYSTKLQVLVITGRATLPV